MATAYPSRMTTLCFVALSFLLPAVLGCGSPDRGTEDDGPAGVNPRPDSAADDDDASDEMEDCDGEEFEDEDCIDTWGYPCTEGLGDGYCDDGAYGLDFDCAEWNWDDGDCDSPGGGGGGGAPTCCNCVCQGCSATVNCSPDCGTCASTCAEACSNNPACGGYVSSSSCGG